MTRSILIFPGSASVPGMPKLDVSEAEIAVSNIQGLKHWPGLFDWDVAKGVVRDRVTDATIPSYGVSQPGAHFVNMVNGKKGYKITALAQALNMPGFDTDGSFTVGGVFDLHASFGSISEAAANTSVPAPWGLYSNSSGTGLVSVYFGTIAVAETVSATWPTRLAADKLTVLVIVFDRVAGKISIRYNGTEVWSYTNNLVKTIKLLKELTMGAVRVAGTGRDVVPRAFATNAFAAFEYKALEGGDLTAFENMLFEAAAAA